MRRKNAGNAVAASGANPDRLEKAREAYMKDPWNAALCMPDDLLDYFPEARQFKQGQALLYYLCLPEFTPEFSFSDFSQDKRRKIIRAFIEYYKARGSDIFGNEYEKRTFSLPKGSQGKMPRHIGLEIEIDDGSSDRGGMRDGLREIRTDPTNDKHSLKRFLGSIQNILFILDDLGLVPLGYELSAHVNLDIGLESLDLSGPDALLGLYIRRICLPNISQARLERCIVIENTSGSLLGFRYGYERCTEDKEDEYRRDHYRGRLHMPMFEVSPTCDLGYFIFTCEFLGEVIENPYRSFLLGRLSEAYDRFFGSNGLNEYLFSNDFLLNLPWLKYHELMYDLRKEILSSFA